MVTSARFSPVRLSYACSNARPPPPSVPNRSVLVTSKPACAGMPVGGTFVSPSLVKIAWMFCGVAAPFGTCQAMSPVFML